MDKVVRFLYYRLLQMHDSLEFVKYFTRKQYEGKLCSQFINSSSITLVAGKDIRKFLDKLENE